MAETEDSAKWYVAHTYSGYENKVKTTIEEAVANRHLEDQILEVRERQKAHGFKETLPGLCTGQNDHERRHLVCRT